MMIASYQLWIFKCLTNHQLLSMAACYDKWSSVPFCVVFKGLTVSFTFCSLLQLFHSCSPVLHLPLSLPWAVVISTKVWLVQFQQRRSFSATYTLCQEISQTYVFGTFNFISLFSSKYEEIWEEKNAIILYVKEVDREKKPGLSRKVDAVMIL